MDVQTLIDTFLAARTRDGCRPSTLRVYRGRLRPLKEAFGERALSTLTRAELLALIDAQGRTAAGRPKSADTRRGLLSILAMLQKFAAEEGHWDNPPLTAKDLRKPRSRRRERLATDEETRRILEAASAEFARIYRALRGTGARPSELAAANIEDIVTSQGLRVIVLTEHKTSRETGAARKIPIGRDVAGLFDAAIGSRQSGPIFLSEAGRRWSVPQLTRRFRTLRRGLELPEELKLYCARHEFGTAVTRRHGIDKAKHLMGHTNIVTTDRYNHPTDQDLVHFQEGIFEREGKEAPDGLD